MFRVGRTPRSLQIKEILQLLTMRNSFLGVVVDDQWQGSIFSVALYVHRLAHPNCHLFYLHYLLFVNTLLPWIQLKYCSLDVTKQLINHRNLRIQWLYFCVCLIFTFWNIYQYVKQNVFIKRYSTTWLIFFKYPFKDLHFSIC